MEAGSTPSNSPTFSDQRFSRQHRLLTPAEFKAVFDHNHYKASHKHLLLLARKRAEPAHDGIHDGIHDGTGVEALRPPVARLGLVIAKKHVRRAVDRNRVKRQLRDSFRLHKQNLIGLDIVALARPGLGALDNTALRAMIDAQWTRLLKQQQKAGV